MSMPPVPGDTFAPAELIAAYFRQNGTLPKATATPDSEEGRLSKAVTRIRLFQRKGRLDQSVSSLLDETCPGWADGHVFHRDRAWQERRDELIAWIDTHGRTPHYASGDPTERALSGWVAKHRRHERLGRHLERIKELDDKVPGVAAATGLGATTLNPSSQGVELTYCHPGSGASTGLFGSRSL